MQDDILALALEVSRVTGEKISQIENIMRQTRLLALNARIEAGRAGAAGAAFGVVAHEMGDVANHITEVAQQLRVAVQANVARIEAAGGEMLTSFRGARLQDIALNAVEIIDRNLYERSCDVRWWATDSAVVQALEVRDPASAAYATERLATILRSYTVYLDLWVVDAAGRVVANGRPRAYPGVVGRDVSGEAWFRDAMATRDGDSYVVADVASAPALGGALTATYATAIRRGAEPAGEPIGALGIFFDWAPQSAAVVGGVGLSDEEKQHARVLLLDGRQRVIAASDGQGVLKETYALKADGRRGFYVENDRLIAYAVTPGYETYAGLGWQGVIEYRLAPQHASGRPPTPARGAAPGVAASREPGPVLRHALPPQGGASYSARAAIEATTWASHTPDLRPGR